MIKYLWVASGILFGCATSQVQTQKVYKGIEIVKFSELISNETKQQLEILNVQSTFLKADAASLRGKKEQSLKYFRSLHQTKPKSSYILNRYALELFRQAKFGEVEELIQTSGQKMPQSKEDHRELQTLLVESYTMQEKHELAQKILVQYNFKEENSKYCSALARSYYFSKKVKESQKTIKFCKRKFPKDASIRFLSAKLYIQSEKWDRAIPELDKTIELDKYLEDAIILRYQITMSKDGEDVAFKYLKRISKNYLESEVPYTVLSELVDQLLNKNKFLEATTYMRYLVDLDPSALKNKFRLGLLYLTQKNLDDALNIFNELYEESKESDKVVEYLAEIHLEKGNSRKAMSFLEKIGEDSDYYPEAVVKMLNLKLDFALKSNEEKEFWKFSRNLKKQERFRVPAAVVEATFWKEKRDYKKSIDELEKVKNLKAFSIEQNYFLANVYNLARKYKKADDLMNGVLVKDPKNAHAWNFLGYSQLERPEIDYIFAKQCIEKALQIAPHDGYILDSMGWFYFIKGSYSQARYYLEKAFSRIKTDPTINEHLAELYEAMNNREKAIKFYQFAIERSGDEIQKERLSEKVKKIQSTRGVASEK